METSRKALRFTASVCLLALAACSSGGGGAAPNTNTSNNNTTNNNTTTNNTTNNNNTTTALSIGAPAATSSGGSTGSFNFTTSLPAVGTTLPLPGPVSRMAPSGVTFPNVTDAVAVFRGTAVSGGTTYPVFDINIPSLSVSASNVKGDSTPVTLSNGQITATLASLNYLVLGVWTFSQSSTSTTYLGQTVTGSLTPTGSVPSSGTATYTGAGSSGGAVGAFFVPSTTGPLQGGSLGGDVNLSVNFGSNSVTGSLSNMHANTTAGGSGTTPWNNVSLSGNLTRSGTVSISGATSTSGPPAGAGTAGFSSAATGTFAASFYGPAAQEVGGSWTLSETTSAGTKTAVGTFAGR